MGQYKIFMNQARGFSADEVAINRHPIAYVDGVHDLETVFNICQHGSHEGAAGNWTQHPNVLLGVRSLAVGDVIEDPQGRKWVVDTIGFKPYVEAK